MPGSADPRATEPAVAMSEVRRLWGAGQRGAAIQAALAHWDRVPAEPVDLEWLGRAFRCCGLSTAAFAVQVALTRQQAQPAAWEGLVGSVLGSGDPWWARDLLAEAGGDSRALQALRIEIELAIGDPAPFIDAWVRTHRDEAAQEAAVDWWVRSDRIPDAARLVDGASGLTRWKARLALWRNRPDAARALIATLPPDDDVRCLAAIACVLEGDLAQAEPRLRELVDGAARAEAWTWLATVLRKQGRYGEAVQAADAASSASTGFNLVARLEREIATDYEWKVAAPRPAHVGWLRRLVQSARGQVGHFLLRKVESMENADALYPLGLAPRDSVADLVIALDRFAGNHTVHLSTTRDGELTSYPLPQNPRQLGAMVQLVLWTRGIDAARALYDEMAPRVGDHPLYRIYHGEVELWMGEYEAAERIFRTILDRAERTRWAWIGLGASVMLQGDLRQAQEIWKRGDSLTHGAPGPTLYVYRGECYRRQGEVELARKELETGLRQKPQRLSARMNLALLDGDPAALARAVTDCEAIAPLLMAETTGTPAERLEQVLVAMRGNRSSSEAHVSYHLWGRLWRRSTAAADL